MLSPFFHNNLDTPESNQVLYLKLTHSTAFCQRPLYCFGVIVMQNHHTVLAVPC